MTIQLLFIFRLDKLFPVYTTSHMLVALECIMCVFSGVLFWMELGFVFAKRVAV